MAVPAGFLQDLLGSLQAVKDEVAALQDEMAQARQEMAALKERSVEDEKRMDSLSENQLIQLRLINGLKEDIRPHEPDNSPLIDELYSHMKAVGLKQTTFAGAAKILKRSKSRIKQIHPLLAKDERFVILPSQSHKQKLLIRLKEFYVNV